MKLKCRAATTSCLTLNLLDVNMKSVLKIIINKVLKATQKKNVIGKTRTHADSKIFDYCNIFIGTGTLSTLCVSKLMFLFINQLYILVQ